MCSAPAGCDVLVCEGGEEVTTPLPPLAGAGGGGRGCPAVRGCSHGAGSGLGGHIEQARLPSAAILGRGCSEDDRGLLLTNEVTS